MSELWDAVCSDDVSALKRVLKSSGVDPSLTNAFGHGVRIACIVFYIPYGPVMDF